MDRRTILQLTGVTFVTGIGTSSASMGQEAGDNEEGEQETEGNQQEPVCEADIQFGDQNIMIDDSGYSDEAWAEVVVENTGDVPSGNIELTVEWLDENGNFLRDDTEYFPTLNAGKTWLAYVRSYEEADLVSDFNVIGEFELDYPRTPEGVSLAETEFVGDDDEPNIAGVVENTREEVLEYIYVYGLFYAEDGTILGGSEAYERDLRAGANWGFELSHPSLPYQADDVVDYEVLIDAQSFRIQG